jgi:hypothetical protein
MNQRERDSLDRYITGNYGADQFKDDSGENECLFCGEEMDIDDEHWCAEGREEADIRRSEERHDEGY